VIDYLRKGFIMCSALICFRSVEFFTYASHLFFAGKMKTI
jgi:hypothetical protein